jgi:hypothetical protein
MSASPRRPAFRVLLMAMALCSSISACSIEDLVNASYDSCDNAGPVDEVAVSPSQITLRSGDSVGVSARQRDSRGYDLLMCSTAVPSWSSADPSIASIGGEGLFAMLYAGNPGKTTVRATASTSRVGTIAVTVIAR